MRLPGDQSDLSRQGRGSNAEADLVDGGYLIATVYTKLGEQRAVARAQRVMDAYQQRRPDERPSSSRLRTANRNIDRVSQLSNFGGDVPLLERPHPGNLSVEADRRWPLRVSGH